MLRSISSMSMSWLRSIHLAGEAVNLPPTVLRIFLAIAAAATRQAVSRALERPPPR
jgi:hypothetical protein